MKLSREETIAAVSEIVEKGMTNFAAKHQCTKDQVQIVIEPVTQEFFPGYRILKNYQNTGPLNAANEYEPYYAKFKEILGKIDFLGYGDRAKKYFQQFFVASAAGIEIVLNDTKIEGMPIPQLTDQERQESIAEIEKKIGLKPGMTVMPSMIKLMIYAEKDTPNTPKMAVYYGARYWDKVEVEDLFPAEVEND